MSCMYWCVLNFSFSQLVTFVRTFPTKTHLSEKFFNVSEEGKQQEMKIYKMGCQRESADHKDKNLFTNLKFKSHFTRKQKHFFVQSFIKSHVQEKSWGGILGLLSSEQNCSTKVIRISVTHQNNECRWRRRFVNANSAKHRFPNRYLMKSEDKTTSQRQRETISLANICWVRPDNIYRFNKETINP